MNGGYGRYGIGLRSALGRAGPAAAGLHGGRGAGLDDEIRRPHTWGESVCINGVGYKIGRLLYGPERPAVADKPLSRVYDCYYRQLNFSV